MAPRSLKLPVVWRLFELQLDRHAGHALSEADLTIGVSDDTCRQCACGRLGFREG